MSNLSTKTEKIDKIEDGSTLYNFNKKNFIVRALYSYMCSALSCCFAMCFKCFGVLFFSVRLISSVVLHVRLTCVY